MKRIILIFVFLGQACFAESVLDRQARICVDQDGDTTLYNSEICKSFRNGIAYAWRERKNLTAYSGGEIGQLYRTTKPPLQQLYKPAPDQILEYEQRVAPVGESLR